MNEAPEDQMEHELNKARERIVELEASLVRAEAEKARFEAIVGSIGDGISVQDTEFRVLYQNRRHKEMVGDHIGEYCYKAYSNNDRVCEGCPVDLSFKDGMVHKTEKKTPGGQFSHVEITASPLKDPGGRIVAGIEAVRDVTDRRKMEAELLKTQKIESIGILAGSMAHEFNNILVAITGNLALAKMYAKPELEVYDIISEAEKASQRAENLARQLLTFSKGGAPLKKLLSVGDLVRDVLKSMPQNQAISFNVSVPEGLKPVLGDETQIRQAYSNIIANALQSMPGGGVISIRAEEVFSDGLFLSVRGGINYVKVSIEDHGGGIADEHVEKIYDPFFTTKQYSSGIGLTTAYSVVEKHDGFITVESRVGSGTVFNVYLPASAGSIQAKKDLKRADLGGNRRVLVMDDEDMVRSVLERMLAQCGCTASFARDGGEMLRLYKEARETGTPYDAVIVDLIVTAGMGGKEAIGELLRLDPGANAIVSSGYSDDLIMSDFRTYGFKGALAKPYRIAELGQVLHDVIISTS